jgi:coenzyme PQQ precursor peptide PqqA
MWEKPEFVDINMSAEIGAYQDDSEDRDETPVLASLPREVSAPEEP